MDCHILEVVFRTTEFQSEYVHGTLALGRGFLYFLLSVQPKKDTLHSEPYIALFNFLVISSFVEVLANRNVTYVFKTGS